MDERIGDISSFPNPVNHRPQPQTTLRTYPKDLYLSSLPYMDGFNDTPKFEDNKRSPVLDSAIDKIGRTLDTKLFPINHNFVTSHSLQRSLPHLRCSLEINSPHSRYTRYLTVAPLIFIPYLPTHGALPKVAPACLVHLVSTLTRIYPQLFHDMPSSSGNIYIPEN